MLCSSCRCQVAAGATFCSACGAPADAAAPPLELVVADGTRVVLDRTLTIGRTPANEIQLNEPSVSRNHARIVVNAEGPLLDDAGSSHGTWLDGRRVEAPTALRAGARIRLGDSELSVENRSDESAAGRTIVVPVGSSLVVPAVGDPAVASPPPAATRPRVASGWALKRLDEAEGDRRYVLRELKGGRFVRMSDADAELFGLLDGSRTVLELIAEAEQRDGPSGPGRLARLLADLGDRGLLAGVDGAQGGEPAPSRRLARLMRPRELTFRGAGAWFDRLYHRGGWLLFTRAGLAVIGLTALAGIVVFGYLIAKRYGTPFVVASKIGLGGLVFLLGRFLVVAVHETAHGLAMASFGRRVEKAGLKLIAVFPFAFVDTSQAWFESRRRRLAVSAAGPLSDLTLGALFSGTSLVLGGGTLRDIFFQLALAAYVGAFFNLNPFLDRDGYQMLVDALREPGLRRRSRDQLQRALRGDAKQQDDSPVLMRYSLAALVWGMLAAVFAIVLSRRYYPTLEALAPRGLVWAALGSLYIMLFIPVLLTLGRPLWQRGSKLPTEVKRARL